MQYRGGDTTLLILSKRTPFNDSKFEFITVKF